MTITRFLFPLLITFLLSPTLHAARAVISSTTTTVAGLSRTKYVVEDGDANNRFEVTRVRDASAELRGAVLLMPGQGANFELYEIDEFGAYGNSLAGYLANDGWDVWGYSPRTKGIALGQCLAGNCPWVNTWGLSVVADDAAFIRQQIAAVHGERLPVIGGWSLGAMMTLATINAYPSGWAGAVVWEGALRSTDPLVTTGNAVMCADLEAQLLLGLYVGEGALTALTVIATLPALVRDPLLRTAATLVQAPPLAPVPGYQLLRGSALGFTYASNGKLVAALQGGFNPVESVRLVRDYRCALAGETTHTAGLGSFTAPLYAIKAGHGFGAYMDETLALLGTAPGDRTVNYQADFAHGDHYAATNHLSYLEAPFSAWLGTVFP